MNGNTLPFDRVISTTSPELLLRMTPALHETRYGDAVRGVRKHWGGGGGGLAQAPLARGWHVLVEPARHRHR
ncbi:MAG UNVERIFIED_CONTAM: hypothetical protein LVT10_18485 [Anaerolineae bacterium]